MMTPQADPWSEIGRPEDATHLSVRRVDVGGRWDFYWGKDRDGNRALVFRADASSMPQTRLPRLRGVDLRVEAGSGDTTSSLVIRLLDSAQCEIFRSLCLDIMSSAEQAQTEREAVARSVSRTWRWHYLLRGGKGLLSAQEQLGLMGELILLESVFIPRYGTVKAVDAWRGPLGEVHDFSCGSVRVEAKARGATGAGDVRISSEHQLQVPEGRRLFLSVGTFESTDDDHSLGVSVTALALRVRQLIASLDSRALPRFDTLLLAAGLDPGDDYDAWVWRETARLTYSVRDEFPRVVKDGLPQGVTDVRYTLSLDSCGDYLVASSVLIDALDEDRDV